MPPPASYTELTFKDYLADSLRGVAPMLNWSTAGQDYEEVLNETMLALELTDIAAVSGAEAIRELRAVGRREALRAALRDGARFYQFSADGQAFNRQQVWEHLNKALALAEAECAALGKGGGLVAHVTPVFRPFDPYEPRTDDELAVPAMAEF